MRDQGASICPEVLHLYDRAHPYPQNLFIYAALTLKQKFNVNRSSNKVTFLFSALGDCALGTL